MASFLSMASPVRWEIEKIKGSRFLGAAAPVASAEEARLFVRTTEKEFPGASHHCYGWRISKEETRYSDAGEPKGTAGKPILNQLIGAELQNTVVVVTRFYGGTKLGTGGLVRAYSAAAKAVISHGDIVECAVKCRVMIEYAYGLSGIVDGVLHGFKVIPDKKEFSDTVKILCPVPVDQIHQFKEMLLERTGAQVRITECT